jgi:hypothetical protein
MKKVHLDQGGLFGSIAERAAVNRQVRGSNPWPGAFDPKFSSGVIYLSEDIESKIVYNVV